MKRFLVIVAVVLSSVLVASGQECAAPDICGVWLGQEKTSKIDIYRKGNLWEGKAVWYSEYGDIGDQEKFRQIHIFRSDIWCSFCE